LLYIPSSGETRRRSVSRQLRRWEGRGLSSDCGPKKLWSSWK